MIEQHRLMVITAGDQTFTFRVRIHKSESPSEHLIEPSFYQKEAQQVPQGIHHEMELLESPVWGRIDPEVPIHIHPVPATSRKFVCYLAQLSTLDEALNILRIWCVGTVFTILKNRDFREPLAEHKSQFLEAMGKGMGIVIAGDFEIPG